MKMTSPIIYESFSEHGRLKNFLKKRAKKFGGTKNSLYLCTIRTRQASLMMLKSAGRFIYKDL